MKLASLLLINKSVHMEMPEEGGTTLETHWSYGLSCEEMRSWAAMPVSPMHLNHSSKCRAVGKVSNKRYRAGARTHANLISLGYQDCAVKVKLSKQIIHMSPERRLCTKLLSAAALARCVRAASITRVKKQVFSLDVLEQILNTHSEDKVITWISYLTFRAISSTDSLYYSQNLAVIFSWSLCQKQFKGQ